MHKTNGIDDKLKQNVEKWMREVQTNKATELISIAGLQRVFITANIDLQYVQKQSQKHTMTFVFDGRTLTINQTGADILAKQKQRNNNKQQTEIKQ